MVKNYLNYLIYTDYYRVTAKTFNMKTKIKTIINYNISAGFRVVYAYRKYKDSSEKHKLNRIFWKSFYKHIMEKYGVEFPIQVECGSGLIIYHPNGIVIHPNAIFGSNCSILQQVTIGNSKKDRNIVAHFGNRCMLGAGSKIIGPINVGDDVSIGAGSVVTCSFSNNVSVGGVPARVLDNKHTPVLYNINYKTYEEWKSGKEI